MKVCTVCGIEYPATSEFFHQRKGSKSGLVSACKNCRKEYCAKNKEYISKRRKEHYIKNKEHILQQHKEYYVEHKDERSQYSKEYHVEHKEQIAKRKNENYIKNKEHISQHGKEYRAEHKDERSQYNKEYYIKHKENFSQRAKEYYKTESGHAICVCCKQKREAIKKSLPATLTATQWEQIKLYFNNRCAYCGEERPLQQEHFIALTKKGEYSQNNIIPACKSCNSSKNNSSFFTWFPQQKFYNKSRENKILKFLNYHDQNQQLKLFI